MPTTVEEYAAFRQLEKRAIEVFGSFEGLAAWPYGLEHADRRWKNDNPELWEIMLNEQPRAQRVIVEWAEQYGLRRSTKGCCPKWLQRKTSRSCEPGSCNRYGSVSTLDYGWLDHAIAWLFDGKPVAMTSAPYSISEHSHERLDWWQNEDECLRVLIGGEGWYGYGTTQILMWRSDRLPVMVTAPGAQRGAHMYRS